MSIEHHSEAERESQGGKIRQQKEKKEKKNRQLGNQSFFVDPRHPPGTWIIALEAHLESELGLGTRVLDGLLDDLLDLIPVASVDTLDLTAEVLLDHAEHLPLIAVGNEGDGDTNATKTASTTNTVKVGLVVRTKLLGDRSALIVFLGNVL